MYLKIIIYIVIFFSISLFVSAQQESQTKPLELPNYIIEGRGQVNVQTGIKQFPEKITSLSKGELDSINSLQKEQSILLPPKPLPTQIFNPVYPVGYLRGGLGRYFTPSFEGGYGFKVDRYNMYANGLLEYSNGPVNNSDYFKTNLNFSAEYVAPDKFWIFGGSKTLTNVTFSNDDYKLFGLSIAPSRNKTDFGINVKSDGTYQGFDFSTGAGYNLLNVHQHNSITDNNISAFLKLLNNWSDFRLGGGVNIDMHSLNGDWMSFFQATVNGRYILENGFTILGEGGLQIGNGTSNAALMNLLVNVEAQYLYNPEFTFKASLKNYMENNNYLSLFNRNPYITDTLYVDFNRNTDIRVQAYYHPDENIYATAGLLYRFSARTPYFTNADSGTFIVNYGNTNTFSIVGEGSWQITKADNIFANARITMKTLTDGGNSVPYNIPIELSANYNRIWTKEINTICTATYVSQRYADKQNKVTLNGFFDLGITGEYKLKEEFRIFAKIQNILNNNIYIWNGYKERDLFFAIGIVYKFY